MSPRGGFANSILQPEPMSNPVGIISPPPALGKFANLIPPFPTSVYLKNLTMVFKDFHKSTLTNQSVALEKKRGGPIKLQKKYLTLLKIFC